MTQSSDPSNDNKRNSEKGPSGRIGGGGWVVIFVLGGFLVLAVWYAVDMWGRVPDVGIPAMGWFILILGAVVTLIAGAGLMALLFYSNRHNRDF
ncbi:MAG: hypothetical protein HY243_08365 [Proteobacteria bacterium]|nr:hypothetical protein [Pseudomonadota bacterium]